MHEMLDPDDRDAIVAQFFDRRDQRGAFTFGETASDLVKETCSRRRTLVTQAIPPAAYL
jgi:hypothetical protein